MTRNLPGANRPYFPPTAPGHGDAWLDVVRDCLVASPQAPDVGGLWENCLVTANLRTPTISIYQNPDHVAGILQQVYGQPLVEAEQRENTTDSTSTKQKERILRGDAKGRGGVPIIGAAEAGLGGSLSRSLTEAGGSTSKVIQNFAYSQAYYLYLVRGALTERGQLKPVQKAEDASSLEVGDFVEFSATFRANEMTALLDILTPDLISEITYYSVRSEGVKRFDAFDDIEQVRVFAEKNEAKARMQAELARAVARAVRVDFRAEKTREFYGTIGAAGDAVTAITMCDVAHFVVEDEDRILDGRWTVLGKVTAQTATDVPILERNKVLDRIKPEGIDDLFAGLRKAADKQVDKLPGDDRDAYEDIFDLAFASRVAGPSFKVVPIAVFA